VCLGWLAGNVHWLRQCGWLRQCRWLSSRTRQPCRDAATASHSSSSIETDSASRASASAARLSLDTAQHKTLMTITPSCCAALHGKPLTHPHHFPQPQTNPYHTPICTSSGPRLSAHKRVFWTPSRAGNREGDFHSRGRRHHAHAVIGARREAYTQGGCGGGALRG
jgi:hypothetical protein